MGKKIRRIKITTRSRELVVVGSGLTQNARESETAPVAICPICQVPIKALAVAAEQPAIDVTTLEKI